MDNPPALRTHEPHNRSHTPPQTLPRLELVGSYLCHTVIDTTNAASARCSHPNGNITAAPPGSSLLSKSYNHGSAGTNLEEQGREASS